MGYRWLRNQKVSSAAFGIFIFPFFLHTALAEAPTERGVRIQQEALVWTTDYEGLIDGKIGDETIKAIKKFQARLGNQQSGALTSSELEALVKEGYARRTAVGFQQYTDRTAGVSVGIPKSLLPAPKDVSWGKSWYGKEKGIAVDTLRFKSDVSLQDLYNKLLNINNRTIKYQRYVEDSWFVISALEKDAAIYVRANWCADQVNPTKYGDFRSGWTSTDLNPINRSPPRCCQVLDPTPTRVMTYQPIFPWEGRLPTLQIRRQTGLNLFPMILRQSRYPRTARQAAQLHATRGSGIAHPC